MVLAGWGKRHANTPKLIEIIFVLHPCFMTGMFFATANKIIDVIKEHVDSIYAHADSDSNARCLTCSSQRFAKFDLLFYGTTSKYNCCICIIKNLLS